MIAPIPSTSGSNEALRLTTTAVKRWCSATLFLLFVGMPLAMTAVAHGFPAKVDTLFGLLLLLSGATSAPLFRLRLTKRTFGALDAGLIALMCSGVLATLAGPSDLLFKSLSFAALLLLRMAIMFVALPGPLVLVYGSRRALGTALTWALAGSYVHVANGMWEILTGSTPNVAWARVGEGVGIHPNLLGSNCAAALLILILNKSIALPVRVVLAIPAAWVLLETGSRSALGAVAGTAILLVVIVSLRSSLTKTVVGLVLVLLSALTIGYWGPAFVGGLSKLPGGQRIIDRTLSADPTAGRLSRVEERLEMLQSSPAIGFGYKAPDTYMENGIVSLALETGTLGVVLYLCLWLSILNFAWRLLRARGGDLPLAGRALIGTSLLLMLRTIGERSHILQISEPIPNLWWSLAGISYLVAARLRNHSHQPPTSTTAAIDTGQTQTSGGPTHLCS